MYGVVCVCVCTDGSCTMPVWRSETMCGDGLSLSTKSSGDLTQVVRQVPFPTEPPCQLFSPLLTPFSFSAS